MPIPKLARQAEKWLNGEMPKSERPEATINEILSQVKNLRRAVANFEPEPEEATSESAVIRRFVSESGKLLSELREFREAVSPVHFGSIGITLGRSDGIAKFFAFSFVNQSKRPLNRLDELPFYGSGVYAIYYKGTAEEAYAALTRTETPIYVGKSTPKNADAETIEEQGQALYKRLKEHAKSISKTNLDLSDFEFRAAPIQTGMQGAVEDFMIRLFKPIWNKEIRICFGIGKHGDKATTRRNKRSPWDTMHPGRQWADQTAEDQMARSEIETKILRHLEAHPVIRDKNELFKHLALG